MDSNDLALVNAGQRAFRETLFYRDLYENEPSRASDIPFISTADYYRANGLLDCIADRAKVIGIVPPFHRGGDSFPFVVPESEEELELRQGRIVRAMRDLCIDLDGTSRFLIVTDEAHGPFACEISKGLYWERCQASIVYLTERTEDVLQEIDLHAPTHTILVSGRHLRNQLAACSRSTIIVEHCSAALISDTGFPALLYADALDIVASRPSGRAEFAYDSSQLLLEVDPRSHHVHATKLNAAFFPLVRFSLNHDLPLSSYSQ
jgi:hypothetical protein